MPPASCERRTLFSTRLVISCLLCWVVTTLMASPKSFAKAPLTVAPALRKVSDFRKDLKIFMKLSKSQNPSTERIAIYNLCQLHREIAISPRFDESLQLQGLRVVIAKRLTTYSADFKNHLKRIERKQKRTFANRDLNFLPSENPEQTRHSSHTLAETRDESTNTSNSSSAGLASLDESADEAELEHSMWVSAVTSYDSLNCVSGGPDRIFDLIGGRLAPPWDHGQDLVDLIATVIHPNSWRNNGGKASIHYYQPSRVLVLHASLQGHHETSNLLEKLRGSTQTQLNITPGQGSVRN